MWFSDLFRRRSLNRGDIKRSDKSRLRAETLFHDAENAPPDHAIRIYQAALSIYQELNDECRIAKCLSNMAHAYRQLNQYKNAIQNWEAALPLLERDDNPVTLADTLHNLGGMY